MFKKFMQTISFLLIVALLTGLLPMQIFAAQFRESLLTVSAPAEATAEDSYVLTEIPIKRSEYTKEFIMSDGLHMAVVYGDAVHYEADGAWAEIDNTLTLNNGVYTNTAGVWDISFAQTADANEAVTVKKDGYTLSFGMPAKLSLNTGFGQIGQLGNSTTAALSSAAQLDDLSDEIAQLKADTQHPETVADKLYSRLSYENVHQNIHVTYDLNGNQIKESVVLNAYESTLRGFRYTLSTGSMIPVLQEDGSIYFYNEVRKDIVMVMPAPYLVDANEKFSSDIAVSLTGSNGMYALTYELPVSWLAAEERAYPVILDPVIQSDVTTSNIHDCTVCSSVTQMNYQQGTLFTGWSTLYDIYRAYVRYEEIPALTSADVIVAARMEMVKYEINTQNTAPIEVRRVLGDWTSRTITWANAPAYSDVIDDFVISDELRYYHWDVTDIARSWYETGNNYGMVFKASDEVEQAQINNFHKFYSANYGILYKPTLQIYFRNTGGLESYWDYSSASAGRAGTAHVNTFSGDLAFSRPLMGFGGNRMPVSIHLVYNANDSAISPFGMGRGWRTNYNQLVYQWEENTSYYIWEDEDGTSHYFKYVSSGTYEDEDNLNLTLTTTGSGEQKYCITDENGNKRYFDTYGRLRSIVNNQETASSVTITYKTFSTGNQRINVITDGAGRKYQFFYYDSFVSNIVYYGTGSTELEEILFTFDSDKNPTQVTDIDGNSTSYTYSGNLLLSAQDVDGYQLNIAYHPATADFQPYRVASVTESHNGATGNSMSFTYATNQTTLKDSLGNTVIQQYNDWGNVTAVQDDQGRASFGSYARGNFSPDTEPTGKNNQLTLSSKLQNTVSNLLTDSSFENSSCEWYDEDDDSSFTPVTTQAYLGSKSLSISAGSGATRDSLSLEAGGTYTLSVYVKGDSSVQLEVQHQDGILITGESIPVTNEWTRVQLSCTNPNSTALPVIPIIRNTGTGTIYADCVQLEKAPTASRYNLIQNGDFHSGLSGWTGSGLAAGDGTAVYTYGENEQDQTPQLDDNVFKITGAYEAGKSLSQTIPVSGTAGDSYVVSGWAKGNSAALTCFDGQERDFGIRLTFHYAESDEELSEEEVAKRAPISVSFNADVKSDVHWQYAASAAVAAADYTAITVELIYNNNANTMYFDGIQLFKEAFGTSYTYDPETGNVVSVIDLQNKETTYEYDGNDLTKIIQDDKVKMTYTYDDWHNVETATTEEGLSYAFEYDTYGNNTKVSIISGDVTISSTAEYTADGNRLASVTDALGNTTTYSYNADTNVLEWVQYPEDTAATRTTYTYDNMYRMATAAATTDSNLSMSASYTYTDDYLTKIQTPTTTYNFTYGDFGLRSSVIVGDPQNPEHVLAEYYYDSHNRLEKLDYGNQDSVQYTYDTQGRVTQEIYEDGATVSYTYDNTGALATVTDSATGITTTYYYDLIDRLVKYEEKGTNLTHSVTYIYDEKNNLSSLTEVINGVKTVYNYTFDDDNRVISVSIGNGTTTISTVSYTYDAFGRMSQQVTKHGDSTNGTTVLTESATFTNPSATATSGQIASYNGFTYTYDANGNITSVAYGGKTTSYEYDSANQLIRENNQQLGITQTWTYDNAGNILNRKEYTYTTVADLTNVTPTDTVTYTYGNTNWGDQLTVYDGTTITYDEIGNPTKLGDWSMEWQHGRQLASMADGTTTWNYTYNSDGLRTKRTNGTTTYNYVYNGSQLAQMTVGNDTLTFAYDAAGIPLAVTHNDTVYYYVTNVQGDVVSILDSAGNPVDGYTYDAWGNQSTDSGTSTIGALNPLRYRGYVYDTEIRLYYLQSRYYDPEIGRFINADALVTTGQGFIGNNMFTYCLNNPLIYTDSQGNSGFLAFLGAVVGGAIGGAIIGTVSHVVNCALNGQEVTVDGLVNAAATGAVTGAIGAAIGTISLATTTATLIAKAGASAVVGIASGIKAGIETDGSTKKKVAVGITTGLITGFSTFIGSRIDAFDPNSGLAGNLFTNFAATLFVGTPAEIVSVGTQVVINRVENISSSTNTPNSSFSGFGGVNSKITRVLAQ